MGNDIFEKLKNFPFINRNGNFFLFLVQLRKSFGPTQRDGEWRIKHDQELRDSDIVEEVKNRILSWTAYSVSVRADFENPSEAFIKEAPERRRPVGIRLDMIWRVCGQIIEYDAQGRVVWRLSVVKASTKVLQGSTRDFRGSKYILHTYDENLDICKLVLVQSSLKEEQIILVSKKLFISLRKALSIRLWSEGLCMDISAKNRKIRTGL